MSPEKVDSLMAKSIALFETHCQWFDAKSYVEEKGLPAKRAGVVF